MGLEGSDQGVPQEIEVADRIQDLVLHELVVVTQTFVVEDTVFVDNHGVVETAPERQILCTQGLDFAQKTEGACTADLFDER